MRTFEFDDGKSHKFWNIELTGTSFTVTYGKVGTQGQTQTKSFPDVTRARKEHDKLVAEKLKKGYSETTPTSTPAPTPTSPLRQALESALVENPDDLATHSAYADHLTEQGDPRGEFIQTQLALENPALTAQERKKLEKRETELLTQHGKQWLGEVGRFLVGDWSGPDKPYHFVFHRGWLDLVRALPVPEALFAALAQCPEARLLRRLEIVYDMRYHPFEFHQFLLPLNGVLNKQEVVDTNSLDVYEAPTVMPSLLESPYLTNLRAFKFGFSDSPGLLGHSTMVRPFDNRDAQQVIDLLAKCPRLDELYLNIDLLGIDRLFALDTLDNLRVLQYYYGTTYAPGGGANPYPLDILANNASLRNLTTLRLHPGRDTTIDLDQLDTILNARHLPALVHFQVHMTTFVRQGAQHIIQSGALRRLKHLDIGYGNLTDQGARLLAACPDLKHLDTLDVTRNALTDDGIATLRATGVNVVADNQHPEGEEDYLFEVDFE
jgi:uncharacterized protein (TIGR02996 family)